MRTVVVGLALLASRIAAAQNPEPQKVVSVMLEIDGKQAACRDLSVHLSFNDQAFVPQKTEGGFIVPAFFDKKPSAWSEDQKVKVLVSCGKDDFEFDVHPGWVTSGLWKVGIAYPPYWVEYSWTGATENGTWLSYLESECDGCDPGVFVTTTHTTPPQSLVSRIRREKTSANGQRARDIAYALAVFKVEYQKNRDDLLRTLNSCLAKPRDSPEDDICDGHLTDYLTNLYWRGDETILSPLLHIADARKDVIGDIGLFYGSLLQRRAAAALEKMKNLSAEKQQLICGLAAEDLSAGTPKFEHVTEQLKGVNSEIADHCLEDIRRRVGHYAQ